MFRQLIPGFVVSFYHLLQAVFACIYFGFPGKRLKVIGVTGTDGKTTSSILIARLLSKAFGKRSVALNSSLELWVGEKREVNATKMTTPTAWQLQRFLSKARKVGCKYAVVETSSHALAQYRTWGIKYSIAILTNISREHLDYHKTMEQYKKDKARLFEDVRDAIILNFDDAAFPEFAKFSAKKKYAYGIAKTGEWFIRAGYDFEPVTANNIKEKITGTEFLIKAKDYQALYKTRLLGEFNVYNVLACVALGFALKVPTFVIEKTISEAPRIPGRMEFIEEGQNFKVLIDYAVTPAALKRLYNTVKKMEVNRTIGVFGACGGRDKGKRPIMGGIVGRNADFVILTNEDPFHENPWAIINQIAEGLEVIGKKRGKDYFKILDRKKAIKKALSLAGPGDIVVITGKGAEVNMAIGDKKIPWSDRGATRKLLKNL